jgi:hypothetical protein
MSTDPTHVRVMRDVNRRIAARVAAYRRTAVAERRAYMRAIGAIGTASRLGRKP